MSTERNQEIEQRASEWLMRRDSGRWTEADQLRLEEWLNASALNHVAFLRLELGWEEAQRLKALGAGINSDEPPPPGQWNLTPFFDPTPPPVIPANAGIQRTLSLRFYALAASLLLAVILIWRLWPAGQVYETPIGGTASVPAPDGSKVTLNTDSEIRIAFSEAERRVELKQGEAFFDVAKDPRRPFVVTAGSRRVVAVGTRFSVRRDGNDLRVVVTEGRVRVEDNQSHTKPVLRAGSVARATAAGVLLEKKTVSEAEERLSWRSGVLMFRNQTLAGAVAEFNRYNTRQFAIADSGIANLKIEGNFRATNIDAFARLLEEVYPVKVEQQEPGTLMIAGR